VLNLSTSGQRVTLTVSRGAQSVGYEVPGTVSEHRVKANFGRAGKVDLRFEPSGPPRSVEPLPFCKGKEGSVTTGTYVGTVRFTGFDPFVHFHASRVRGKVSRTPPVHCHIPGGAHPHPKPEATEEEEETTAVLYAAPRCGRFAFAAAGDRDTGAAGGDPRGKFTLFAAISKERVGRVHVSRFVLLFVPGAEVFTVDSGLASASVAPPPPFHGSAAFQRGVDGAPSTWTGSLSVSFLDGRLALTGKGIEASLVAGDGSSIESECESGHAQMSALSIP
jgi:hypothetical protein